MYVNNAGHNPFSKLWPLPRFFAEVYIFFYIVSLLVNGFVVYDIR